MPPCHRRSALSVMSTKFRQQVLDTHLLSKLQRRGVDTILFNFTRDAEFQVAQLVNHRPPVYQTVSGGCPEAVVNRVAATLGEFVQEKDPENSGAQIKLFLSQKRIEGAILGAGLSWNYRKGLVTWIPNATPAAKPVLNGGFRRRRA